MKRALLVLALAAWSAAEAVWQWTGPRPPDGAAAIGVLWAFALPLPLLAARRAPLAAALGVVALVIARDVAGYRAPGAAAQSVILLVAMFASEAGAAPRSVPVRGLAAGGLLLAGWVGMDLAGVGPLADATLASYAHVVSLIVGGVGAGIALRDRRGEAERREREVRELEAGAEQRIDVALASERARIAAEVEAAVRLLLDGVRPLAERAAHAPPELLASLMGAVQDRARTAMLELRRAVDLLRAPAPRPAADLGTAVAATRRTRIAHALGWVAPVALLAALGVVEQIDLRLRADFPFVPVPPPALGELSPWITAVVCVLPLLARRRAPVAATLAVYALVLARMLVHDYSAVTFTQYYVTAAAAFLGAAHVRRPATGLALTAAGVATSLACMTLEEVPYEVFAYSFVALLPAAGGFAGLLVRDRVATAARARRAHERADRGQEELAREHVLAERLKAARELHDVVGHAVTIVTLQSAVAARYATVDLERARVAAATAAQVAGEAESDLARLGALLEAEPAPPVELTELIARAGMPVTLDERVDGDLPLSLRLAAVRVVQEALTNVGRHAGRVPTTVKVSLEDAVLVVEVVNAPGTAASGAAAGAGWPECGSASRSTAASWPPARSRPAAGGCWRGSRWARRLRVP